VKLEGITKLALLKLYLLSQRMIYLDNLLYLSQEREIIRAEIIALDT
jgi:hypothetical protein